MTNHYNGIFMGLTTVNAQSLGDFKPGKDGPKSLERPKLDETTLAVRLWENIKEF